MNKRLEAGFKLLDLLCSIYQKIAAGVSRAKDAIENEQYPKAFGPLSSALSATREFEGQVNIIMKHRIIDIYQEQPDISQTLDSIRSEVNQTLKSTQEFKANTEKLLKMIRDETAPMKISAIFAQLGNVQNSLTDIRVTEFCFCAKTVLTEYEIWQMRVSKNKNELLDVYRRLNLHPRIRRVSQRLFKDGHYRNAILDSYIEIEKMTREKSRIQGSPRNLFGEVFSPNAPRLRLNKMKNSTDRDEQEGFMHIYMGTQMGIRNPKAHDTKVQKDPYRTLEYLCMASLLAKRIDESQLSRALTGHN